MTMARILVETCSTQLTTMMTMAVMITTTTMMMMAVLSAAAESGFQTTTTSAEDWVPPINGSTWPQWEEPGFFSEEQALMHALVGHYENSVRPVYDANDPVDVRLGLTLTQILDLDEKNQVLTTNVWLEAEWYDQRLGWNSSDFGGISSIRIPCERIWLPDIVLYNSVDDYTSGYMPSLAMVYNDSRVFWGPVIRFRSSCKIDITYFPFDDQVCNLKIGSWAYNGFQVNVWNRSHTMDLSNLVDNGEWELVGVKVERNVVYYNCCDEPFPDVTFFVHLRRRVKYYFMNIIIPCIILSFLCLAGFLLPPESGEKITLGLSVLLTITVFMLMVADKMPQTSESISVISIYLMVVLATSCLSVLSSVWVLSIHHQRGQPRPVPSWLRFLIFSIIARVVCVSTATSYRRSMGARKSAAARAVARDVGGEKGGGRKKERKMPRSPRRSRVATEDREYLRMEHRRTKTDSTTTSTTTNPPPTHPLLQPFSPLREPFLGSREGGWCGVGEESEEPTPPPPSLPPRPFYPVPLAGRPCSACSGTGVVVPRSSPKVWTQHTDQSRPRAEEESPPSGSHSAAFVDTESEIPREATRNLFLPRAPEPSPVAYRGGERLGHSERESRLMTDCAEDRTFKESAVDDVVKTANPLKTEFPQKSGEQQNGDQSREKQQREEKNGDLSSQDSVPAHDTLTNTNEVVREERHTSHSMLQNVQSISSTETLYTRRNLQSLEASPSQSTTRENSQNESTPEKADSPQDVWQKRVPGKEDASQEDRFSFSPNTPTFSGMRHSSQPSRLLRCEASSTPEPNREIETSNATTKHSARTVQTQKTVTGVPKADPPDHRCCPCWRSSDPTSTSTSTMTMTSSSSKDRVIIQRLMTMIQSKHGEEVKDEELYREWHDVACVLDRLLFCIFLIVTVVSSAVVLKMRPKDVHF